MILQKIINDLVENGFRVEVSRDGEPYLVRLRKEEAPDVLGMGYTLTDAVNDAVAGFGYRIDHIEPTAAEIGRRGGLNSAGKTSEAKARSSRANGRKGGRPKTEQQAVAYQLMPRQQ